MSDSAVRMIVIGGVIGLFAICITLVAIYAIGAARDVIINHEAMDTTKALAQYPNSRISFDVGNIRVKSGENGTDISYNGNYGNGALGASGSKNIGEVVENITKFIQNICMKK